MSQTSNNQIEVSTNTINAIGNQYLTFILANEEYGIDILSVQEIKVWEEVTPIPNTPDYVLGVMNLRGAIVPIIDVRKKFNLESIEYGAMTVVIVVKVDIAQGQRVMGLVVDAVSDVYNISSADSRPTPDFGCAVDMKFIKGLASIDKKMIILLDVNLVIEAEVMNAVSNVRH